MECKHGFDVACPTCRELDALRAEVERLKEQVEVASLLSRKNREERDAARAQLAQVQAEAGQLREALIGLDLQRTTDGDEVSFSYEQLASVRAALSTTAGRGYVSPERLRKLLEKAVLMGGQKEWRPTREIVSDLLKEAQ